MIGGQIKAAPAPRYGDTIEQAGEKVIFPNQAGCKLMWDGFHIPLMLFELIHDLIQPCMINSGPVSHRAQCHALVFNFLDHLGAQITAGQNGEYIQRGCEAAVPPPQADIVSMMFGLFEQMIQAQKGAHPLVERLFKCYELFLIVQKGRLPEVRWCTFYLVWVSGETHRRAG